MRLRLASAVLAVSLVSTLAASSANAQTPNLPPSQPPPATAVAPNGEYVAPLQQQTQQTYVPQSVALSGPRVIQDYQEGDPVPPGYHADTRVRKGLVIGGAVTFGVMYLLSALVGAAINDTDDAFGHKESGSLLFIPVLGPFLQMGKTDSSTGKVTLAIDGLAQGAGAAMLIGGLVAPKTVLVRNDLAEISIVPMQVGISGSGAGLVGKF